MAEKIKMSQIRAQFPMYADLPDDQLLIGVRRRFYPDIPMGQLTQRIEFDTQRFDPTEGMSTGQKVLAGVGKAFTDIGRGAGQMLGVVSRDDVRRSRELDAPLMATGAGLTGNILGNVAAFAPTAFIPGANTMTGASLIGAGAGLLAPSASTGETVANTAVGGVAAPAGMAIGRGLGALYQGGKALVEPLTKAGQERIAARTLQSFAQNPERAARNLQSARPLVPGSLPTMAQAADDAGLAQLERTLQNNPEVGPVIAGRLSDQRAARLAAIKQVAGTDDYYNAIKDGVRTFAREDYQKAIASGINQDAAQAMQPQIESILRRPSIKEAQRVAMNLAAEADDAIDDFGSIKGLDYLKKALDNQISRAKAPGNSVGNEKLRLMVQTKDDLMSVLEEIAPNYKEANDNFTKMMRQVNSMDVARALQKSYEPALSRFGAGTREHAQAYASALDSAVESVRRQAGVDLPLGRVMDTGDISTLESVARDLARKARAEDMGRAVGSNTAQNLASQNLLRRALGPTGLPQSWAESTALQTAMSPFTGIYRLGGAEQRILDRLGQAALNPADAAGLLMQRYQAPSNLLGMELQRYIPAASAGLLSVNSP